MTPFTTDRLTVRPWAPALADPASTPALQARLARILTPDVLEHLPPDFAPDTGPGAMSRWLTARAAIAEVSLVETDGTLIGLLFLFRPDCDHPLHLGYLLAQSAWGKGYATELLQGLVRHLRQDGPFALVAGVTMANTASARVLLKIGFEEIEPDAETHTRHFRLEYL